MFTKNACNTIKNIVKYIKTTTHNFAAQLNNNNLAVLP